VRHFDPAEVSSGSFTSLWLLRSTVRMSASHPKATESLRSSEMTLSARSCREHSQQGFPLFDHFVGASGAIVERADLRVTVRFLRRHEDGGGQAPSFGGVAETFVARNRGARVQAMDI